MSFSLTLERHKTDVVLTRRHQLRVHKDLTVRRPRSWKLRVLARREPFRLTAPIDGLPEDVEWIATSIRQVATIGCPDGKVLLVWTEGYAGESIAHQNR